MLPNSPANIIRHPGIKRLVVFIGNEIGVIGVCHFLLLFLYTALPLLSSVIAKPKRWQKAVALWQSLSSFALACLHRLCVNKGSTSVVQRLLRLEKRLAMTRSISSKAYLLIFSILFGKLG